MSERRADRHWAGRHVVVTGGTSGIGLEVTRQLRSSGARVTALGLPDLAATVLGQEQDATLRVVTADVTDPDALAAAIDRGRSHHGTVGAVITCAGISRPGYFLELEDHQFRRHMDVNYFGTLHAVRAVLPNLLEDHGASVTCIASVAGFLGVFGYSAYSPSKFAVSGLCQVLRQELRPRGVSVTAVFPPDVDTPMLTSETPLKPPELLALSSGDGALSAARVARELLAGTAAGRATVVPGAGTQALCLANATVPRLLAGLMDRTIARAARGRPVPAGYGSLPGRGP